ncbi:MAG: hypothetical protein DIZ80_07910 [endosymbiont of Galathealinum brachiosum]|uniref:Uncharacterized protein n=1 Tax=endosymbiont of Galathealinum brachiosum TaxID=2200906 RepID=A0A370DGK4_9GAMM|nr:MAG: hypothetical protein DIZ80_07910 [endosymbiont of Galathealinum brachiosum]
MTIKTPTPARAAHEMLEVKKLLTSKEVNSHIKLGWKLIGTFNSSCEKDEKTLNYCIGWPKSAGKIQSPVKSFNQKNKASKNKNKFIYSIN